MTLSILGLFATLSITVTSSECHNTERRIFIVMLSVIMVSVVMLNAAAQLELVAKYYYYCCAQV